MKLKIPFALLLLTCFLYALTDNYVPGEIIYKYKQGQDPQLQTSQYRIFASQAVTMNIPFKIKEEKTLFKDTAKQQSGLQTLSAASAIAGGKKDTYLLEGIHKIKLENADDLQAALEWLKAQNDIEYAHPNFIVKAYGIPPNDTYYVSDQKAIFDRYDMTQAWAITTGSSSVIVAVVDSGVDYNHIDLAGKVINGHDYVNNDDDPMDDLSHGTHVAGIIAANTDNGIGVAGMAWNVKILAIKVLNSVGSGSYTDMAAGVIEAVNKGAQVINLSVGGPYDSGTIQNVVNYAYANNVAIVAAAGNDNIDISTTLQSPVCNDGSNNKVIGVASVGTTDVKSWFSNYSADFVDVSAIGEHVYSTVPNNLYAYKDGTSMATPMVCGLVALMFSKNPQLTVSQIQTYLANGATNINSVNPSHSGKLGRGRIDAYQTMLQVSPPPTNNTTDSTITKFYNFPNPASSSLINQNYTSLYVLLTAIPQDIKITIYSLSGRKIKTFNKNDFPLSVTTYTGEGAVAWYLADENNNAVPPGVYVALLEVTDSSGKTQRKYHKVVVQ